MESRKLACSFLAYLLVLDRQLGDGLTITGYYPSVVIFGRRSSYMYSLDSFIALLPILHLPGTSSLAPLTDT